MIEICKECLCSISNDFKPREVLESVLDLSKAINEGIGELCHELCRVREDYDGVKWELEGICINERR